MLSGKLLQSMWSSNPTQKDFVPRVTFRGVLEDATVSTSIAARRRRDEEMVLPEAVGVWLSTGIIAV